MSEQPTTILECEVADRVECLYVSLRIDLVRFFRPWKVTPQQYNVLRILAMHADDTGIPNRTIVEHLPAVVPDMTRMLDRLERAKLIKRRRPDDNRRVVRVRLTRRGRDLVGQIREPLVQHYQHTFAHLEPRQLRILDRLLRRALDRTA